MSGIDRVDSIEQHAVRFLTQPVFVAWPACQIAASGFHAVLFWFACLFILDLPILGLIVLHCVPGVSRNAGG